ncbi:MAG: hypothetical protein ACOX63_10260 [Christensenellales bacterium]|jgi:hypothetical protein
MSTFLIVLAVSLVAVIAIVAIATRSKRSGITIEDEHGDYIVTDDDHPFDLPSASSHVSVDMSTSNWVQVLAIIVLIASVVIAFITGQIIIFSSGVMSSLMFFVFGTIIDRQNKTINLLREISSKIITKEPMASDPKPDDSIK